MARIARPKIERRKKSTSPALPPDTANDAVRVAEDDIALRAYTFYCERGGQHGADLDDWLRAEQELLAPPGNSTREATAR